MATRPEYEEAAKKLPSNRTVADQALVDDAYKSGMVDIKNLDHAAKEHEKTYGPR